MSEPKHQSKEAFQHQRLHSSRSIRLLSLLPASKLSAPLNILLTEVSLDDFPSTSHSYKALSYVWGERTGTIPCTCDGKKLLITPNCNEALQHLRYPDEPRMMWVDAVCIDQEDNYESMRERNNQVTLMGEVYGNATSTYIWLGRGKDYTAGLFEKMRKAASEEDFQEILDYDCHLRQQGKLNANSTCLDDIFGHDWNSRVWTLQEVVFSKHSWITCGNVVIPWKNYIAAARLLPLEFARRLGPDAFQNIPSIHARAIARYLVTNFSSEGRSDKNQHPLTQLLSRARFLQTTNPKDKIYGFYSVFLALGVPLPAPNYEITRDKLYEEACIAIINASGSLEILMEACSNSRSPGLPSWVMDWEDEGQQPISLVFQATKGSRISQINLSALSPGNGQLHLRGKLIGSIIKRTSNDSNNFKEILSPILDESYDRFFSADNYVAIIMTVDTVRRFREWMRPLGKAPFVLQDGEIETLQHLITSFDPGVMNTSIFNTWVDILQYPGTSYDLSDGREMAEMLKVNDKDDQNWTPEVTKCLTIAASLVMKSIRKDGNLLLEVSDLLDFSDNIKVCMDHRSQILVHTEVLNEMILGSAIHTNAVSDSIVLLEGLDAPAVLRQKGDKWLFMGLANVMGIMNGEAWPGKEEEMANLQNFVLI